MKQVEHDAYQYLLQIGKQRTLQFDLPGEEDDFEQLLSKLQSIATQLEAETEHEKAIYGEQDRQKTAAEMNFQDVLKEKIVQQNQKTQFLDQINVHAPSAFLASLVAKRISVENPHYRNILDVILYQNRHFNPLKRDGEEQKTWLHMAIEKRKTDVVEVFLTWCIQHHRNPIAAQTRELATLAGDTILHGIAQQLAQSNEQEISAVTNLFQSILTKLMIILREDAAQQYPHDQSLRDRSANQQLILALLQQNRAQKTAIDYLLQSNNLIYRHIHPSLINQDNSLLQENDILHNILYSVI